MRHDVAPMPRKTKMPKPGLPPAGRLGIYDRNGNMRGHVGPRASAATVRRFGIEAELSNKDGRPAWVAIKGRK
jgi:hypothetical protein